MGSAEIERLEREIEAARGRVVTGLAQLKAPGTLAGLKQELTSEALAAKDDLVERTREAAADRMHGLLDGVKARIAANPVAALAIGAGIAWRLVQHPPIATALLGYGLYSLFRTDPDAPPAGAEFIERAGDAANSARRSIGDAVGRIEDAAVSAGESAAEWAAEAGTAARDAAGEALATAEEWTESGRDLLDRAMHHKERDRVLLGAAGLALAAAIGIAWYRRSSADEDEE